ncbi:MAG: flavodoxin family protein [Acidimicrobiales bacterium]
MTRRQGMKVLVTYESRGGRTRRGAEALAAAIRERGQEATLKPLSDTTAQDVAEHDVIAVGTWVEGLVVLKVGPAKAALAGIKRLGSLTGKPVAVFCTYGVNPRNALDTMRQTLVAQGANVIAENASHHLHPERGMAELAGRICTTS